MASVVFVLTGLCLLVMGMTAKIPPSPADRSAEQHASPDTASAPSRRAVVIAAGMLAVLYGLYRLGH